MSTCLSVSTVVGTEGTVAIVEKREEEGGSMEYGGGRREEGLNYWMLLFHGGDCTVTTTPQFTVQCLVCITVYRDSKSVRQICIVAFLASFVLYFDHDP